MATGDLGSPLELPAEDCGQVAERQAGEDVDEVAPKARMEIEIATGPLRVEGGADEVRVRAAIEQAGYGVA